MRTLAPLAVVLALAGCANMQSHDKLATEMQTAGSSAGIPAALARLEASATTEAERSELLYNLERGELLRMDHRYEDSTKAFLLADARVKDWEEAAKTDPQKLMGTLGAALISERLKVYEGQDYEKVWLTTTLALNRVALGDLENARVDIKRTHEREAVIAEFRAKELLAAEEEAKSKGATSAGKEISGYPVETLNDPEVLELRNGYSNALSHYLAGYLYEVLGESGLAAPGYRKAIELKPNTGVLEEGLRGLDSLHLLDRALHEPEHPRTREVVEAALRPVERGLGRADDEHLPLRFELDRGRGLGFGQRGHGDERRDLGRRLLRRPAGELAHVHELDRLLGKRAEERGFLRAGDDRFVAGAERGLEGGRVAAAKLMMHLERRAGFQRRGERVRFQRNRVVTAADLKRLAFQAHRLAAFPSPAKRPPPWVASRRTRAAPPA